MLCMIAYYRLLGGLASVALLAYGLLSFAVLLALRSTLTLPGIAGFVLAIGMAVDANVLVFERMREEHRAGDGLRRSLERGFSKAFSAIADASITTLLAAGLLFFLASGAVRGFGVTLSVGVLVSLFCALVITRVLVELATRVGSVRRRPGLLGLDGGGRLAGWLATRGPDLLGRARWWLAGPWWRCCWPPPGWWRAAPASGSSSPAAGCSSTGRPGRPTSTPPARPWPGPASHGRSCRPPGRAT
jgi:SecD/SecF fusion protein